MGLKMILLVVYGISLVYAQTIDDIWDTVGTTLAPQLAQTAQTCQLSNGDAGMCIERLYCRTPIAKVVRWRQNRVCTIGECCKLSDVIDASGVPPNTGGTTGVGPQTPQGGTTGVGPQAPQGGTTGVGPQTPQGGTTGVGPQTPQGGTTGNGPQAPLGGTTGVGPQTPQGGTTGVGPQNPQGGTTGFGPQTPQGGTTGVAPQNPQGGTTGVGPQTPQGGTTGVGPQTPNTQRTCGFQRRQTVQGFVKAKANEAEPGEFPWAVNILNLKGIQGRSGKYSYIGTGSLIHEQVVLTAAHLVNNIDETNLRVIYGDHDQAKKVLAKSFALVSQVEIHSNFNSENADYNFALAFLKTPVAMLPHVGTVCLPPANYVATAGTTCMISGWGADSARQLQKQLTKTVVPAVDHSACEQRLRLDPQLGPGFQLLPSLSCAGGEVGKDICGGAGGSPLVCPIEGQPNRFVQTGIVSWVTEACGVDGAPGVFADVATARTWIDQKMTSRGYSTDSYTF